MICQHTVSVAIHDGQTATILGDLHDHDNGLSVGVPVDDGEDVMDRIETDSPFVLGMFEVLSKPAAGRLEVLLTVEGSDWVEAMTRFRAAREWWRQAGMFWVDVNLAGDTLRYLARRPDVSSAPVRPMHIANGMRSFVLSFPVQPNPVVVP